MSIYLARIYTRALVSHNLTANQTLANRRYVWLASESIIQSAKISYLRDSASGTPINFLEGTILINRESVLSFRDYGVLLSTFINTNNAYVL